MQAFLSHESSPPKFEDMIGSLLRKLITKKKTCLSKPDLVLSLRHESTPAGFQLDPVNKKREPDRKRNHIYKRQSINSTRLIIINSNEMKV